MKYLFVCLLVGVVAAMLRRKLGALTDASIVFSRREHGQTSNAEISFELASDFPIDGKVVVTFPDAFSGSLDAVSIGSVNINGGKAIGVAGKVVTITCSGNSVVLKTNTVLIVLENIQVPPVDGSVAQMYTVATTDDANTEVDSVAISEVQPFLAAGLSFTKITLENSQAGGNSNVDVAFTLGTNLPGNGKIVLTFAEEVNSIQGSPTISATAGKSGLFMNGTVSIQVVGKVVTIARDDSDSPVYLGGTSLAFTLESIVNPNVPTSLVLGNVQTTTVDGFTKDFGDAQTFTIIPGFLSNIVVSATRNVAGAKTVVAFSMQNANPVPADGAFSILFPPTYILPNDLAIESVSGIDGTLTISKLENTVKVLRSGGGQIAGSQTIVLSISNVNLPSGSTHSGSFPMITTMTNNNVVIDQGSSVGFDMVIATILLSPSNIVCTEAGPTKTYNISMSAPPSHDVTIQIAKNASDDILTLSATSIVFSSGDWSQPKTIALTLPEDFSFEQLMTVEVSHTISSVDNVYTQNSVFQPQNNLRLTIYDNDAPFVLKSTEILHVYEGLRNASYTLELGSKPTHDVTISMDNSASLGLIELVTSNIVFTSANWNVPQAVTLYAIDDEVKHENFNYNLVHTSSSLDSSYGSSVAFVGSHESTINFADNDRVSIVLSKSRLEISEDGPTSEDYYVYLSMAPTDEVTVTPEFKTLNSRATFSPSSIVFTTANWNIPQAITISIVLNSLAEGPLQLVLDHSSSSSDARYTNDIAIFTPSYSITINVVDNDYASVLLSEGVLAIVEGESLAYNAHLTSLPSSDVSINIVAGSRLTAIPTAITFTPQNWNTKQEISIQAISDDIAHDDTVVAYVEHNITSADAKYIAAQVLPRWRLRVDIYDTDNSGVKVSLQRIFFSELEVSTYSLVLLSEPTHDVSVSIVPVPALAHMTISTTSITFTSGNWNVPQVITLTALGDYSADGVSPYEAQLTHVLTSTDTHYSGGNVKILPSDGVINVTLYDKDVACSHPCSAGKYSLEYNSTEICIDCPRGYYCTGVCASPSPCNKGTYLPNAGGTSVGDCIDCDDGYFSSMSGSTACSICPKGFSCANKQESAQACSIGNYSLEGATSCIVCLAGYACASPSVDPVQCSTGTYSIGGQTECSDCPKGQYCSNTTSSPSNCDAGKYSLGNQTSCTDCPAGSYCFDQTKSPRSCSEGSYSLGMQEFCLLCPGGFSCASVSDNPVACSTGEYSVEGSSICRDCPAGYECPSASEFPVACGPGNYSLGTQTECTQCPAGSRCPSTDSGPIACNSAQFTGISNTSCINCPAGSYCSTTNQDPIPCLDGYYSLGTTTSCTECPEMHSCGDATVPPQLCSLGDYSFAGATVCEPCPAGRSCNVTGELHICPSGYYSPAGEINCIECEKGKYCADTTTPSVDCAPGQFSAIQSESCTDCIAGQACKFPYEDPLDCPDGFYSLARSTNCTVVPAGMYSPNPTIIPQPCPNGTYSLGAATNCTSCPPGFGCEIPSNSPVQCGQGTYSPGGQNCIVCSAGNYCPEVDKSKMIACLAGSFALIGASNCTVCPPGMECPYTTQDITRDCEPGKFSTGGQQYCTSCSPGWQCPNVDGSANVECTTGYYSIGGTIDCTRCIAGHYCPDTNQNSAIPCSNGTYSVGGQSSCISCPAGFACPDPFDDVRITCVPGTYSIGSQEACTPCPAGYACPSTSSLNLVPCVEGSYSTAGIATCITCPAGSKCLNQSSLPIACDPGFYSLNGSSLCTACEAGYECPQADLEPQPCPIGFYSPGQTTHCLECDAGYRCKLASTHPSPPEDACPIGGYCNPASTFFNCPPGTVGNTTAGTSVAHACRACDEGYFCEGGSTPITKSICPTGHYCPSGTELGSNHPCPSGTYNNQIGEFSSAACLVCPAGFYCSGGTSNPVACPFGYYCPEGTTSAFEHPCPGGTYGDEVLSLTHSGQCKSCISGSYCPQGSVQPTSCPAGSYNPSTGAAARHECLQCLEGFTCPRTGQFDVNDPCEAGHYCPLSTIIPTAFPCPAGTYSDRINNTRAEDCIICPERHACLAGTGGGQQPKLDCIAGHYCPNGTQFQTQFNCPPGTWSGSNSLASSDECTVCETGKHCIGGQSSVSGNCSMGYYCPLGSFRSDQFACPSGTYSNQTNLAAAEECDICPKGHYCPSASNTPTPCPGGSYAALEGSIDSGTALSWPSCISCPPGYSCVEGSVTPLPCGIGMHSNIGASACLQCLAGHFCSSNTTATLDMLLLGGDWGVSNSQMGRCYNGTYCPAGTGRVPTLTTHPCPTGTYCPTNTSLPMLCPPGTYNNLTGQDGLEDCLETPSGYYSLQGSNGTTGECAPGYYCPPRSTSSMEVPCPRQFYRNASKASRLEDCSLCYSGSYCPEATSTPIMCPRGFYCTTGVSEPHPCPISTFGNGTGLRSYEECSLCSPGMFCDGTGLSHPRGYCDPGYFCRNGSYTSAPLAHGAPGVQDGIGGPCESGGYCPLGSSHTYPCPAGTYNSFVGSDSIGDCSPCPPGLYCLGVGVSEPTGPCGAGYFCNISASVPTQYEAPPGYFTIEGAANPSPCLSGTYNSQYRQSNCSICPQGYYCDESATIIPKECPRGRFCVAQSGLPERCPAGTFSNDTGLISEAECIRCTPGYFCGSNGLTSPTGVCDAGYYCSGGSMFSNPSDAAYGLVCPPGHYCPPGSASGVPCPAGTFRANAQGLTLADCTACSEGSYCATTRLLAPSGFCNAGYYCLFGSSTATPLDGITGGLCPQGHFCPNGTISPIKCSAGTYTGVIGKSECTECPAGFYCDGIDSTQFQTCPAGHYCPSGSLSPSDCPIGSYSSALSLTSVEECYPCPGGSYCETSGLTSPTGQCDAGYYCRNSSFTKQGAFHSGNHSICPPGHYCEAGSSEPVPCDIGTYSSNQRLESVSDCSPCDEGHYCASAGLTEPTGLCSAGFVCKLGVSESDPITGIDFINGSEFGGMLCTPGHYCPEGCQDPIKCLAGTYMNVSGASQCIDCPAGYVCEVATSDFSIHPCQPGYYCPVGTKTFVQFPCLPGTYNPNSHSRSSDECIPSPGGTYSSGYAQSSISGQCANGFYCTNGSTTATPLNSAFGNQCSVGSFCPTGASRPIPCQPGSYCVASDTEVTGPCMAGFYCLQGSFTANPTGQNNTEGLVGDECPAGFYCPEGTSNPVPCPSGTYSQTQANTNVNDCLPCTAGFVCPETGTRIVTQFCKEGFYCPEGQVISAFTCPLGYYCPTGTADPLACPSGAYQNQTGGVSCPACPERYYCELATIQPKHCEVGYFCPSGTMRSNQYPCIAGTWSNETHLASADECSPCPPGMFCDGDYPTSSPSGICDPGYYCSGGSTTATPSRVLEGGLCSAGYICIGGAYIGTPIDGLTGYPAPVGTYSLMGDIAPRGCAPGYFNSMTGQAFCQICSAGSICQHNATKQENCPERFYCPEGIPAPILCHNGSYGASPSLVSQAQCSPCPPRKFCVDGRVSGECGGGHYCRSEMALPQPQIDIVVNGSVLGGPCPSGHYCPNGTFDPIPCPNNSSRSDKFGISVDDCYSCPSGSTCEDGSNTKLCPVGHYCPYGMGRLPCPKGTFNDVEGKQLLEDCLPCTAGKLCNRTAIANQSGLDAPAGGYTLNGDPEFTFCAPGSFRSIRGGIAQSSCTTCPGGHFCVEGAIRPKVCPPGYFCPLGAGNTTNCPAGSYCPLVTTVPISCPVGYYCEANKHTPSICPRGTFCEENSSTPTACPLGHFGIQKPQPALYISKESSCNKCSEGTYGNDPNRLNCSTCVAGYVCKEGTVTDQPTNFTTQRGYRCPKGFFCPNGTRAEIPCPRGTYNPDFLGNSSASCKPCAPNTYQFATGQQSCLPCSKSATSEAGSSVCECIGNHRAFQMTDGYCICEPGYEFLDTDNIKRSDEDGDVDCQPLVYARCGNGEVRSDSGVCTKIANIDCSSACLNGTGEFVPSVGLCQCDNQEDIELLCNKECQDAVPKLKVDPDTGHLYLFDPVTNERSSIEKNDSTTLNAAHCSGERSLPDGRGCTMQSIFVNSEGFKGTYDPTEKATDGRRRLTDETQGVSNPMVCILSGDGVVFLLTGGPSSYPIYLKDSMLNTNPNFDYGAFRRLAQKAKSSTTITTFAFTFDDGGVYVFANSENLNAKTIVVVMEEGTTCPTEGAIVPTNEQNLIAVNAKRSTDIILAPNWTLIGGLLLGLFAMVAGIVAGIYYFRRRSWTTKGKRAAAYRKQGKNFKMSGMHSKGSVVNKQHLTKDEKDLESHGFAPIANSTDGNYELDLDRWDADDIDVRELVDRLQFHHDFVSKAFQDQNLNAEKLMKLLKGEADELRRLLASVIVGSRTDDGGSNVEASMANHLLTDAEDRKNFLDSEKQLQQDLVASCNEVGTVFGGSSQENANSMIDDIVACLDLGMPSEWTSDCCELIDTIPDIACNEDDPRSLVNLFTAEAARQNVENTIWDTFSVEDKSRLSPSILRLKEDSDANRRSYDLALNDEFQSTLQAVHKIPRLTAELKKLETAFSKEYLEVKQKQNPNLTKKLIAQYRDRMGSTISELKGAVGTVQTKSSETLLKSEEMGLKSADAEKQYHQLLESLNGTSGGSGMNSLLSEIQSLTPGIKAGIVASVDLNKDMERLQSVMLDDNASLTERHLAEQELLRKKEAYVETAQVEQMQDYLNGEIDVLEKDENNSIEKLKANFLRELQDNPDLTDEERERMLDEFNSQVAGLEDSLNLERKRHEEELRNRIALRKLKKERQQSQRHNDEATEDAILKMQIEEAKNLEESHKAEQLQKEKEIEEEYARELSELDAAYNVDNDNAVNKIMLDHQTKLAERNAQLFAEAEARRAKLRRRLKEKQKKLDEQFDAGDISASQHDESAAQLKVDELKYLRKIESELTAAQIQELESSRPGENSGFAKGVEDEIQKITDSHIAGLKLQAENAQLEADRRRQALKERLSKKRSGNKELLRKGEITPEEMTLRDEALVMEQKKEYVAMEHAALEHQREAAEKIHEEFESKISSVGSPSTVADDLASSQVEEQHEVEIEKIRADHDKELNELKGNLNLESARRKQLLRDRLNEKKLKNEELLKNGEISKEENIQVLTTLEQEEEDGIVAIEQEYKEKEEKVTEQCQVKFKENSDLQKAAIEAGVNESDEILQKLRLDHEEKLRKLKENLQLERSNQGTSLKERLKQRKAKRKNDNKLDEPVDDDVEQEEAAQEIEAEQKAKEEAAINEELERQKEELNRAVAQQEREANAKLAEAAKTAEQTQQELDRMREEHQKEFSHLETTLTNEKSRQVGNLKERLEKRKKQKEREMQETGKNELEVKAAMENLRAMESEETEKLMQELESQANIAMEQEKARQERERLDIESRKQEAAKQAAAAAAVAKAMEKMQQNELQRLTTEFSTEAAKFDASQQSEYKAKKSKLENRIKARRKATQAALEQKTMQEARELAEKQKAEAQEVQDRLETSNKAELWQQKIDEEMTPRSNESEEGKALDAKNTAKLSEMELAHAAEAKKLIDEQEAEARKALEMESIREEAELEAEIQAKKDEMEKQLAAASANMVKEEFDRIRNEYHGKLQDHASRLESEKSKKKSDLKRRLTEKKKKKQDDLQRRQTLVMQKEVLQQKEIKTKVESKALVGTELDVMVTLLEGETVPPSQVCDAIEMVMSRRHFRECSDLAARQFAKKSILLKDLLQKNVEKKLSEKTQVLQELSKANATAIQRRQALIELEARLNRKHKETEDRLVADIDGENEKDLRDTKSRQFAEVTSLFHKLVSDGVVAKIGRENAQQHVEELRVLKAKLDEDTERRVKNVRADTEAEKSMIKRKQEAQIAELDHEYTACIANEKTESNSRLKDQCDRMVEELSKKVKADILAEKSSQAKAKLQMQFEKNSAALRASMEQDKLKQDADLMSMLGSRRQKKRKRLQEDLKEQLQRKDVELVKKISIVKEKASQALQDINQTQLQKLEAFSQSPGAKYASPSPAFLSAVEKSSSLRSLKSKSNRNLLENQIEDDCSPQEVRDHRQKQVRSRQIVHTDASPEIGQPLSQVSGAKISDKLGVIETLIRQLNISKESKQEGSNNFSAALLAANQGTLEDSKSQPEGHLEQVNVNDLGPRHRSRYKFGETLIDLLEMGSNSTNGYNIKLIPVKTLPECSFPAATFKNTIQYGAKDKNLYIRYNRMDNAAELASIIVHSLAHIKTSPTSFSDDNNPAFITEYHKLMGRVYQAMFTNEIAPGHESPAIDSTTIVSPTAAGNLDAQVPDYFRTTKLSQRIVHMQNFLDTIEDPMLSISDDEEDTTK